MHRTSFADVHCSIAHTQEIAGEWGTPLVLRDVALGIVCFDDLPAPKPGTSAVRGAPDRAAPAALGPG